MKPLNSMTLKFESRSVNESFARTAVAAFLLSLDPTVEEITDIKTAVSEAVTNAIVHGYENTIGTVYISCQIFPDGRVTIKIKDNGKGIADVSQAMEPLFTTGGEERSGLGFTVMQSVMDKLSVKSKLGGPTTVKLERRIVRKSAGNM